MFVIPGTQVFFGKYGSGSKFGGKDTEHIDQAAEGEGSMPDQEVNGPEECCHAIDEEHKNRGISHPRHFPSSEGLQCSEQYFQAPAKDAAAEKGSN